MRANFDLVFDHVMQSEGGYSNHPNDPGGPTRWGVTLVDLRIWRRDQSLTAQDVKVLAIDEAKQIFRARYWDLVKGDALPAGLDYAVSDFAYNSGVSRAVKFLQQLLGVKVDGVLGEATLEACETADLGPLIAQYQDKRLVFLKSLNTWPVFGRGWGTRVKEVRANSLTLASAVHADTPAVVAARVPEPVAPARDAKVAISPLKRAGQGSALGLFGTQATDYAQQLAPHVDALPVLKYAFTALMLAGIAAGLLIALHRDNQA